MVELRKDPKVIAAAHKRLVHGERVLWAARQPPLDWRIVSGLAKMLLGLLASSAIIIFVVTQDLKFYPGFALLSLIVFSPHIVLWTLEMMSRQFLVTDRRVIFVSAFWPFRWCYWNHSELDAGWIHLGRGHNVIHFGRHPHGIPRLKWNHAVYAHHVENVAGIETVRETILAQIALNPPPAQGGKDRKNPPVPGTRTG